MKRNVIIIVCLLGVLFLLFKYKDGGDVVSPADSINENVKKLKASGEINSDQENLMKIQLAIVDYIAVKHTPPESLDLLVPRYFKTLPLNPDTKKPFQYEKKGDSYVILDAMTASNKTDDSQAGQKEEKKKEEEFLNPNNLEIEDFVYVSEGKRDPFLPFDLAPKTANNENLPPLERYDLAQLKVSAILTDKIGGMVAIVEDATGKGYTVKVGSKIGDKNGTVVSIDETQLNVLEKVTDFTGEVKQDLRSVKLQKASEPKDKKPSKRK